MHSAEGLGENRVYVHTCNACNLNDHNDNMQVAHVIVHVPEIEYETSKWIQLCIKGWGLGIGLGMMLHVHVYVHDCHRCMRSLSRWGLKKFCRHRHTSCISGINSDLQITISYCHSPPPITVVPHYDVNSQSNVHLGEVIRMELL